MSLFCPLASTASRSTRKRNLSASSGTLPQLGFLQTSVGIQVPQTYPPQFDLQVSAPTGTCAHHLLPHVITLSVRHRDHPRPPHRPGARGLGCGHVSRSLALGAFVSGGVKQCAPEGRRLPEAGPSAPPPPATLGVASPGTAGRFGRSGPQTASPKLRPVSVQRRQSLPSNVLGPIAQS